MAVHSVARTCARKRLCPFVNNSLNTHHCLKGAQSTWMMQFFTSVFVLTSSLLLALYTTSKTRDFLVTPGYITCNSIDRQVQWSQANYLLIPRNSFLCQALMPWTSCFHRARELREFACHQSTHTRCQRFESVRYRKHYLGVCRGSSKLKLLLLSERRSLSSGSPPLMPFISWDP